MIMEQNNTSPHIIIDMDDMDTIPTFEPEPRTQAQNDGVYFIDIQTDKQTGEIIEKKPIKISDYLRVVGIGQDENESAYIVIEYRNKFTHHTKTTAIKQAEIGTHQGWCTLQDMGIGIMGRRQFRERLADYLQFAKNKTQYQILHTTGWKGESYFLPSGEVITPDNAECPKIIYMGDTKKANEYRASGTLDDWREHIARYAVGNSRLMLVLGTAFSAPLLRALNMENGGFHLFGDSRDGKSTTAHIGLSVWGSRESKVSWNATALAIINSAYARNDCFMVLDEIGEQKDTRIVAQASYSLGNGQNKGQAHKDGGNRANINFKTLFFSTGEKPLDTYIKNGDPKLWNAGQAVRLASIPADAKKGYGVFDTIHHFETSWDFAEYLNESTAQFYGTAGRAWIHALQNDPNHADSLRQYMADFQAQLPPNLNGQIRTVGKRFALVYASLELASQYGITGFQAQASLAPLLQCFHAWLERNGTEKSETQQIIEQARDFFDAYADGMRFVNYEWAKEQAYTGATTAHNHAGYKFKVHHNKIEFWVISKVFKNEIAQGFEVAKVVDILSSMLWLKKGKGVKSEYGTHQKDGKRFFIFVDSAPPESE